MRKGASLAFLLVLCSLAGSAQTGSDFSGYWALVPERSQIQPDPDRPSGTFLAYGVILTIVWTPASITLVEGYEDSPSTSWVYPLDGSESTFVQANATSSTEFTLRARWERETLILTRRALKVDGELFANEDRIHLDEDGFLVVEVSWAIPGQFAASVYKRTQIPA